MFICIIFINIKCLVVKTFKLIKKKKSLQNTLVLPNAEGWMNHECKYGEPKLTGVGIM